MSMSDSGRRISRTLFGYLTRDMLFSFLVSFLFFFSVFFINQLLFMAQDILTKRVPLYQVALLVFYALPTILAMSAPFASLMGTLITVGRLSSGNEILVIFASGLSYRMIFLPALAVGTLISLFSFLANDVLLPAGMIQYSRLHRRILVSTPAIELESNSVKRFRSTTIVTGPVTGQAIDNLIILDRTSSGERRIIMAENARLKDGGREGLSLELSGTFIQSSKEIARNDYDYASSEYLSYWVPQDDFIQALTAIGPNQMSSSDLRREIAERNQRRTERLDERYGKLLVQALDLEDSLRKGPHGDSLAWNRRESNLNGFMLEFDRASAARNDLSLLIYRLEYFKKFSIPFGALSFVLLAVSLGLMARKSGQTAGFILGVIISAVYWTLIFGGQAMGQHFWLPPFLSMWLPNILALLAGLILFLIRIRR